MFTKTIPLALLFSSLLFTSCNDDEVTTPDDDHEEELITTVTLTLTDTSNLSNTVTATWADLDGVGGNEPTQMDTLILGDNTVYYGDITFLNESETPSEDITSEILEEAAEHIICYDASGNITVARTDSDGSYEIGLTTLWTVGAIAAKDSVSVSLKHQPDEKDGTCTPGETDVEVQFIIK